MDLWSYHLNRAMISLLIRNWSKLNVRVRDGQTDPLLYRLTVIICLVAKPLERHPSIHLPTRVHKVLIIGDRNTEMISLVIQLDSCPHIIKFYNFYYRLLLFKKSPSQDIEVETILLIGAMELVR